MKRERDCEELGRGLISEVRDVERAVAQHVLALFERRDRLDQRAVELDLGLHLRQDPGELGVPRKKRNFSPSALIPSCDGALIARGSKKPDARMRSTCTPSRPRTRVRLLLHEHRPHHAACESRERRHVAQHATLQEVRVRVRVNGSRL